jgi:copper chaperone CopZ
MIKKKFKIEGMHCTSCALNIDFDLEDLEGIKKSQTNYAKQETEVEFDEEKVSQEKILEQIQDTGYQAIPQN